jgi:hypothetical protein
MMKGFKGAAALAALMGILGSSGANAACWSAQTAEAAEVRDLETMLMVASLRCRLSGRDFLTDYNKFVRASRPALTEANDRLRTHYAALGGLNAYDRYVTSLANRHGGGSAGMDCRDMENLLDEAREAGRSVAQLAKLARSVEGAPALPGGRCGQVIARAR